MSTDLFMGAVGGCLFGVFMTLLVCRLAIKGAANEVRKLQEESERDDPANWWKYGKNPPLYSGDDDANGGLADR